MTTPKAKLYQIFQFGEGLKFQTEPVLNTSKVEADVLPGSTAFFKPNHAVQFRCTLSLPGGLTVVSDLFPRKKDAEQHASKQALEQMSVQLAKSPDVLTTDEKWENLRARIIATFTDKNVQNYNPLRQHFKAAVKREGSRYGQVPLSAIVTLDTKIHSLCKLIDRKAETNPAHAMALLCKAARNCPSVKIDTDTLCLSREEPYSPELVQELVKTRRYNEEIEAAESEKPETNLQFVAVHIPCSTDTPGFAVNLVVKPEEYYLDVIARELGVKDGGRVVFSRPVGKTHPSMRMYWCAPKELPQVQGGDSDFVNLTGGDVDGSVVADEDLLRYSLKQQEEESNGLQYPKNVRASLLMGYAVHGEVILAAVGGDWTSHGKLYALDITPSTFYRMLLQRFPQGSYKVSRGAILATKLPNVFSSRAQWKGMSPRALLIEFCQYHRLPEPVFALTAIGTSSTEPPGTPPSESSDVRTDVGEVDEPKDTKSSESDDRPCEGSDTRNDEESNAAGMQGGPFTCKVRVEWQKGSPVEFESDGPYRNRHDAQQSASLKALHQFDSWFESCMNGAYEPVLADKTNGDVDKDPLITDADDFAGIDIRDCWDPADEGFFEAEEVEDISQTDKTPPAGSMVTVRYTVRWYNDADCPEESVSNLLEKHEKFEFELGGGAVIGALDSLVSKMSVGETACVTTSSPAIGLLSALAYDIGDKRVLMESGSVMYTVRLMKYVEAPEERMEAAHFKPSLSKQRVEYALQVIKDQRAKSLIDLGCGSGSLLESLLEQPTDLRELVGVDVSHKSLIRAAKLLTLKLKNEKMAGKESLEKIDLYEGSIADYDPRLGGADVAVCIEVVEHMDPEPLEKFGSTVLGMLRPQVLIVSTPNFEYNPILQGLPWDPSTNSLKSQVEVIDGLESDVKQIRLSDHELNGCNSDISSLRSVKFRNEDHRFEWTRSEFRVWASNMAVDHSYDVKFSGVGGSGEDEGPGYASQIALFTRRKQQPSLANGCPQSKGIAADEVHLKLWHWASGP
ncbi:small RNA 2'-O-methyltransferase [Marchantia polymorpha subsp. ruderalis]|uniref:Small RNA 2'-O-methyltransferase n=2 Tax=Marchantia polymorpha TaxID=3197 RepID=A0A176VDP7_MARPO|nr:hypothetical protein AXG93_4101s1020 [Marchantia polymorpha subsp. ruderalis]PTQ48784.1 hypothetical protein MARPO_0004s0071 [Marchantia polymorpha]BBN05794.1 hypothetical protein Mp_3g16010 [Marchantia polymorpha subsp. ruderalis]|eukprot:PTQ48784.1 hypothetical protein MARPO_0004s0071 [Marchantia polymorpha]